MPVGCGLGGQGPESGQETCRGLCVRAAGPPREARSGVSGACPSPMGLGGAGLVVGALSVLMTWL